MKSTRQKKLIELIEQNEIGTQEELALMLKKSGFDVPRQLYREISESLDLQRFREQAEIKSIF